MTARRERGGSLKNDECNESTDVAIGDEWMVCNVCIDYFSNGGESGGGADEILHLIKV